MKGCEQTIEEEFGEVCDESVASLSDDESSKNAPMQGKDDHVQVQKTSQTSQIAKDISVKSLSSSDEMSSFSESKKKEKMNKIKKKDGKKTNKSLPPLKAQPPLKGNRMFLRGLPLSSNTNKTPEKFGQDDLEEDIKSKGNIVGSSLKINAEVEINPVSKDFVEKDSPIKNIVSPPKMNQASQQILAAPVKSQKSSSLLGDLPPLPMSTSSSSTIMVAKNNNKLSANDIFGAAGAYDECVDVDDEDSFGDDDIDALLGGLDQFDAQRKAQ